MTSTTTARVAPGSAPASQREAFARALVELGHLDPLCVVLDGDVANSTRADEFARAHPDRFYPMGIAEQNMVGVAAGMAHAGLRPWATAFGVFLSNRALDQIRVSVCQTNANVTFAAAYCGLFTGRAGKTHQDVTDLAVMRALPGMTVLSPADAAEAIACVHAAHQHDGPVYLRLVRDPTPQVFAGVPEVRIGQAVRLRSGGDVALVSTSTQTARVLAAADLLAAGGISATVLHCSSVRPLDADAVLEAAARTGQVVTVEEHTVVGGLGSAVAEVLAVHHPTPMAMLGIRDRWGASASNDDLLREHRLTPEAVAADVATVLDRRRGRNL